MLNVTKFHSFFAECATAKCASRSRYCGSLWFRTRKYPQLEKRQRNIQEQSCDCSWSDESGRGIDSHFLQLPSWIESVRTTKGDSNGNIQRTAELGNIVFVSCRKIPMQASVCLPPLHSQVHEKVWIPWNYASSHVLFSDYRNKDLEILSATDVRQQWGKVAKIQAAVLYEPVPLSGLCNHRKRNTSATVSDVLSSSIFNLFISGMVTIVKNSLQS